MKVKGINKETIFVASVERRLRRYQRQHKTDVEAMEKLEHKINRKKYKISEL